MTDIIDLTSERNKRQGPAPEYIRKDDFGRPMFCFLLSYEMDNRQWSTELWAYDLADAQNRVAAMRASLTCDGQIFQRIDA